MAILNPRLRADVDGPRPPQLSAGKEGAPSPRGEQPAALAERSWPPSPLSHLTARPHFRADALETEEGLGMEEPLMANTGTEALQPGKRGLAQGCLTTLLGGNQGREQKPHTTRRAAQFHRGSDLNMVKASRNLHGRRQLPHHHCSPRHSWSHQPLRLSFPSCPLQEMFPQVSHVT